MKHAHSFVCSCTTLALKAKNISHPGSSQKMFVELCHRVRVLCVFRVAFV